MNDSALVARDAVCVQRYAAMLRRRPGVAEHVARLEADLRVTTELLHQRDGHHHHHHRPRPRPRRRRLAVLLRGQAYRGTQRETFRIDDGSAAWRAHVQAGTLQSIVDRLIVPYERRRHDVGAPHGLGVRVACA